MLAPLAEAINLLNISSPIYKFFSYICHQMPSVRFIWKIKLLPSVRDVSVFTPVFLAGFLAYPFLRSIDEVEPLPRFWLFLALIPMGVDWSLGFFGIWENTHFSRFLTGLILGIACAIFIIPALVELSQIISQKLQIKRLSS